MESILTSSWQVLDKHTIIDIYLSTLINAVILYLSSDKPYMDYYRQFLCVAMESDTDVILADPW